MSHYLSLFSLASFVDTPFLIGQYLAESFKFSVSFAATLGTLLALGQTLAWMLNPEYMRTGTSAPGKKKSFFDVFWNITKILYLHTLE